MKNITIYVDDDIYQFIEMYSSQVGEDISVIFTKCCIAGFQMLRSSEISNNNIESWKKEHNFGKYGRRKTLSYTLC